MLDSDRTKIDLFDRQIKLIGREKREKIDTLKVGVAGTGILGTALVALFSRLGVSEIRVLDKDNVEIENFANNIFLNERHLGMRKTSAAADIAEKLSLKVVMIRTYGFDVTDFVNKKKLLDFVQGLDIVYGCFDNIPARLALNYAALKEDIKYVDLGLGGWIGRIRLIDRQRACYACNPLVSMKESVNIFTLLDKNRSCEFAPTVTILPIVLVTASLSVTVGLKYLGIIGSEPNFDYLMVNLFAPFESTKFKIEKRLGCPVCGKEGEIYW